MNNKKRRKIRDEVDEEESKREVAITADEGEKRRKEGEVNEDEKEK